MTNEPANATPGKADDWFTPGRFALIFALFIVASFPGVLFGQETFFYRDYGLFTYPVAYYVRECFWHGELPLWNPLNDFGVPLLAQWNTCVLYPPSLFYLLFPLSWSLAVFNLAHLFWAGLGMYFLAHRWTQNRLAASVAGLAFGFNGLGLHLMTWISNLAAWAWMPWVVLLVELALDTSSWRSTSQISNFKFQIHSRRRTIVLAAVAGTMQMLAGAPEIILLTWAFVGVLALMRIFSANQSWLKIFGRLAAIVLLIAGLSAAQLLPFFELLKHSQRSPGYSNADWAMPFSGLANFLVPLFHCFDSGHGVFVQYGQYWVASYYLGVGIIALALVGALFARSVRVWIFLGVALLSIWMALGPQGFLYPLIGKFLPVLGLMRYPVKFIVLPVFIIPLLAAWGVSWFETQMSKDGNARVSAVVRNIGIILLAVIAVIVLLAWKFPWVKDDWSVTWHCALGRTVFLVLTIAMLVLLRRATEFKMHVLLRCALLAFLWLDVYTNAPVLLPTVQRSIYEPNLLRARLDLPPKGTPGEPRFMGTYAMAENLHTISLTNAAAEYLVHRLTLYDDCNLLDSVPTSDGFFSLYLREPARVRSMLFASDQRGIDAKGLKDFAGIAHISTDADTNHALDWAARESAMPLISGGQNPVFGSEADTENDLMSSNFDPRKTVYLPMEARDEVKAARADVKINSPEMRSQQIRFSSEANAAAMVTIAQSHYTPWHAYVDGAPVKLWRANLGFQALQVPAGKHEVRMVYEDKALEVGSAISIATFLLAILIWITSANARRDEPLRRDTPQASLVH